MNTKLTLSIDSKIIESAKKYSKKKGISLSKVVEEYLKKIASSSRSNKNKPSLKELRGILGKAPEDFNYKNELGKMLEDKFLK
jgi:hypothetical protein